jgi:hypothetical protein
LLLALFALYHWIESPALVPSRKKAKETAASVDRTQYLQKSHQMRDSK